MIRKVIKRIPKPKLPNPNECCGTGCKDCVWIKYFNDLENYRKILKSQHIKNNS